MLHNLQRSIWVLKSDLHEQVNVTHLWTLVAAALVSFSFIFKSMMSSMFDSVIFMFVVHPYDVGDAILINGDLYKVLVVQFMPVMTVASTLLVSIAQQVWQNKAQSSFQNRAG